MARLMEPHSNLVIALHNLGKPFEKFTVSLHSK